MSRVFLLFMFSLSVLVGSINGQTGCGSTPSTNWRDEMERSEESMDKTGRIGYECEGYSGGSGSGSASGGAGAALLGFFILVFIISAVSGCIWCICVQRQKAINAANLNNAPGQVALGTDPNLYPQTNTVPKGDPNYQV